MRMKPVAPTVSFGDQERQRLDRWDRDQTFEQSVQKQSDRPPYSFYDGPPFATGLPHYGHLVASVLKDVVPRFWSMKGFSVERRWGWDCHGLPVENEAQKELGLNDAREIEEIGIVAFNQACRDIVLRYTGEWRGTVRRFGRWVDHDRGYRTMDASFMESVWWVFKRLWDEERVYEGYRVQPVSPTLGTPLSNFEVAQGPQERDPKTKKDGHKRRQDPSLTVRLKLNDEDASIWVWTTTPWTLPSNLAVAVHPDIEYVKVQVIETGEVAYLEPGRLADYQERGRLGETRELGRVQGKELVGRTYQPLFPYFADLANGSDDHSPAFRIVAADYVGTDAGTGLVHQAPAFGEEDFQTGKRERLPLVNPLDVNGIFDDSVPDFAGQFAKDADAGIMKRLKQEDRVVDQDVIVHAYPHCYRTDQPLLYMAVSNWFVRVEDMRERLVEHNQAIRWVPESVGSGRFGNWLAGARDWNVSRRRFWGTPLPIWRCETDPTDMVCIGSVQELEELAGFKSGTVTDLHRDHVDQITFPSKKNPGAVMRRVSEVFDCWFESGSMPYAQNHYPFENEEFVETSLPADFIAEGLDQTRGWFYTLMVLSTSLFDRPAFKNVVVNGIVLAADGEKMSKSKRNFPDPNLVLEDQGADALRMYLLDSPVMQAGNLRFDEAGVKEKVRSVLLPLWNATSFLTRYADLDGWEPDFKDPDPSLNELDGWVLSRMQGLIGTVDERMQNYELFRVAPAILEFIDDLTNWYIRRSRRRFWRGASGADADKQNAYRTLHTVLLDFSRVLAPFLPFISEEIHESLSVDRGTGSVHLESFPTVDPKFVNAPLEQSMGLARVAVTLGRSLREQHRLRVRQPLASLTLVCADATGLEGLESMMPLIAEELNVKQVIVSQDESALVTFSARPNLKLLGPRLGPKLGAVRDEVAALDGKALATIVAGGQCPSAELPDLVYDQETLLVDRTSREGLAVATEGGVTVALDLEVSDLLRREGLAREVINRVQGLRKDSGLELDDRIRLHLAAEGELEQAIAEHWDLLAAEVLATERAPDPLAGGGDLADFEVEGHPLRVALARV
ncbi:MAG: isoleucine--tRNA ligase [Planctomycetes bacterium]|nr:isoleucine--tRNA ligase [Planctomycetota bacterium]